VECLQVGEKPIAEIREAAGGQLNAPFAVQLGLDLPALLVLQVAGSAHMDDQIIPTVLARFHQPGQRLRAQDRMG